MKKVQAIAAIESSLAKGSATPCTWRSDRDTYIAEESQKLIEHVIDPVPALVVSESFSYGAKNKLQQAELFAVARNSEHWLLFAPATGEFSLAFGSAAESLTTLGFSSNDALCEWLG